MTPNSESMETLTDLTFVHSFFPLSGQKGQSTNGINKRRIISIAKNSMPVLRSDLERILEKHFDFLFAGGAGGAWQTILVGGLVVGLYNVPLIVKEGEQASFERANLIKIELSDKEIPFANFCSVYNEKGDFSNANFSYCLFTDSFLEGADFHGSNLQNTDFSRASLRDANFQNANLQGVDFENCDLTGADFRNTEIKTARFPGANLEGVLHSF
jgi:uncharacterized protein YjbI with pentapeptide repeats